MNPDPPGFVVRLIVLLDHLPGASARGVPGGPDPPTPATAFIPPRFTRAAASVDRKLASSPKPPRVGSKPRCGSMFVRRLQSLRGLLELNAVVPRMGFGVVIVAVGDLVGDSVREGRTDPDDRRIVWGGFEPIKMLTAAQITSTGCWLYQSTSLLLVTSPVLIPVRSFQHRPHEVINHLRHLGGQFG